MLQISTSLCQRISLPIRHSPISVTRVFTATSLLMAVPLMEMGLLLQTYPTLKVRLSMIITNRLSPFMHRSGVAQLSADRLIIPRLTPEAPLQVLLVTRSVLSQILAI